MNQPTSDAIERWRTALAHGDEAEVARLVRQSRADWVEVAASGQLGPMLGQVDPSASSGGVE